MQSSVANIDLSDEETVDGDVPLLKTSKGMDEPKEDAPELIVTKKRFNKPLTEEMLTGEDGLLRLYREFPKICKFHGRGSEAKDIKRLCTMYKEWAFQLHPGLAFPDFLSKCEALGSKPRVRANLDHIRSMERDRYLTQVMGVKLPSREANDLDSEDIESPNKKSKSKDSWQLHIS